MNIENDIDISALSQISSDTYSIIDIRDELSFSCGHIPGAINIPYNNFDETKLPRNKILYIYCRSGEISKAVAEKLRAVELTAFSIKGGYNAWLKNHLTSPSNKNNSSKFDISIKKQFRKTLLSQFIKAIDDYSLVKPNDTIAVCISGGKDSFLMAKLFQEYRRHFNNSFSLVFLSMDPGYSDENKELIKFNSNLLNVPITTFETNIFECVHTAAKNPCYLCARMRRGHLYSKAKELGCNKIALGHHYDDIIETILMGLLYSGQIQTMMPKLKSTNFEGIELIRPMYLIREENIEKWRDTNNLRFLQCACRFTDTCSSCDKTNAIGANRQKIKQLIKTIKSDNPLVESNIFRSIENINLSSVIGYKDKNGIRHFFTENY